MDTLDFGTQICELGQASDNFQHSFAPVSHTPLPASSQNYSSPPYVPVPPEHPLWVLDFPTHVHRFDSPCKIFVWRELKVFSTMTFLAWEKLGEGPMVGFGHLRLGRRQRWAGRV